MSNHVLKGFKAMAALLRRWLEEAEQQGRLREGLNLDGIATFLVISMNGAAPLYAASHDPAIWQQTLAQLHLYMKCLRKQS
jgi:hypothetical protein